jgi:phosphoenolpyruvate synthase/pyruvate phosphate dikinase
MDPTYILPLAEPAATLAQVGGKGASLARLSGAGLPVPDGFHVTTEAYRRFVQENGLQAEIEQALEAVDLARPSTLEAASKRIQERFLIAQIPPEIAREVIEAYAALPGQNPAVAGEPAVPVAVRSSATAEDLPEASFAGQQETYLNVSGPEAVLEATRKCWASLWTARAIGYRARQDIPSGQVALAVVVQLLIPAEAAGILFTANPVNGRRDQAVISASWGLGEAVVGGAVTPDSLVLEKASGQVVSRETSTKEVMTVRSDGGTEEEPVPETLRRAPVLDDRQAAELNRLGADRRTGAPVDIEWALAGGNCHSQARRSRPWAKRRSNGSAKPEGHLACAPAWLTDARSAQPALRHAGHPALVARCTRSEVYDRLEPVLPEGHFRPSTRTPTQNATFRAVPGFGSCSVCCLLTRHNPYGDSFTSDEARPEYRQAVAGLREKYRADDLLRIAAQHEDNHECCAYYTSA